MDTAKTLANIPANGRSMGVLALAKRLAVDPTLLRTHLRELAGLGLVGLGRGRGGSVWTTTAGELLVAANQVADPT